MKTPIYLAHRAKLWSDAYDWTDGVNFLHFVGVQIDANLVG